MNEVLMLITLVPTILNFVDRERRMTYIKKISLTMINADKYAYFMTNVDKNADSMFNTENFYKFHNIFNYYEKANFI